MLPAQEQKKEREMGGRVLSLGMMVCDTIISPVPEDILSLDCFLIDAPVRSSGGDALNVAMALSKMGVCSEISVGGLVGNDPNGRFILDDCAKNGLLTDGMIVSETVPTACSYVLLDSRGERHFLSELSAFGEYEPREEDIEAAGRADVVFVGSAMALKKMNESGIEKLFKRAREAGALTVMDAATNACVKCGNWMEVLDAAFRLTDIFFPSIVEAEALTGTSDPEKICAMFSGYGMKGMGVKLGADGSFVTDFKECRYIPCPKDIKVVDTTGAGDCFMAGFITGQLKGLDVFDSAALGSAVASFGVGQKGTHAGIPKFDAVRELYEGFYGKLLNF